MKCIMCLYSQVLCLGLLLLLNCNIVHANDVAPKQAIKEGYNVNTFVSYFDKDIDYYNIKYRKYNWYTDRFFNWKNVPLGAFQKTESGSLIIKSGRNYEIATAAPVKGKKKWVGTAFGGGGYFEAELKFDPHTVLKPDRKGWPSFWSMSIEHLANLPEKQWKGQPEGFVHFIEVDIFEYYFKNIVDKDYYISNIHDTYGIWKVSCPKKQFCTKSLPYDESRKKVPFGTNFNEYHKYGFLWVPATKKTLGYCQFYFDNQVVGDKITWSLFEHQPPTKSKETWTFGVLDLQHLVLILGTGIDQPLTIRSVKVWQNTNANNLIGK